MILFLSLKNQQTSLRDNLNVFWKIQKSAKHFQFQQKEVTKPGKDVNTYSDSNKEINEKYSKFSTGDTVRISKYKDIFAKDYTLNWSEEVFVVKKAKSIVPWTYLINDCNGEEIAGTFYENQLQKTNQKEYRIEKVINRNGDKISVKWKCYGSSFNSWIDKKGIV